MSQADIEISIFHRSANDYGVTLRYRHAAAGQILSASGSLALDKDALRQHQHDPTAYGELLAAQLLAGEGTRGFLDTALAVAASQRTPLHLRLFVHPDAEALHDLRWETLRLPGSPAPLAARAYTGARRAAGCNALPGNRIVWRGFRAAMILSE